MKIYFDVSCLNRPFDDQTQTRIHEESEAVIAIFEQIDAGRWEDVASRMVEIEVQAIKDATRRRRVLQLLSESTIELSETIRNRARELSAFGLGAADAVHVAAAEAQRADILLTCDDRLVRLAKRFAAVLMVRVENPVQWLKERQDATNDG